MPRPNLKVTCLFYVFLVFICLQTNTLAGETPLQALQKLQEGIDTSNYKLFSSAMDIDATVANAMPKILEEIKNLHSSGQLALPSALAITLSVLNTADATQLKIAEQLFASELKTLLASGVNNGYFAGQPKANTQIPYNDILEKMTPGRKAIIGKSFTLNGNKALVKATLADQGNGEYPLVLNLEKQGNLWRIVGIDNAKELMLSAFSSQ